ncbi:MAG: substrate-binding domain-containing protein [Lachnospiraceae bacterium]|nr:substrate-binding domain-containing protein [Lachnospiraceae bacterium]
MMKKRAKRCAVLAAALALSLAAGGCGKGKQTESVPESAAEPAVESTGMTVGISLPNDQSSIWVRDAASLTEQFQANGYAVELLYSGDSASQQASDIKKMVADGCSLLIIAPVDRYSVGNALETARADVQAAAEAAAAAASESGASSDAGTETDTPVFPPVLSLGSLIMNTDAVNCALLEDSYKIGQLQGEAALAGLSLNSEDGRKTGTVEFVAGDPEDPTSGLVFNGMFDTLQPYLEMDALGVVSGQMTFTGASAAYGEAAQARLEEILSANYSKVMKLGAILGGTDEEAAAAAAAVRSSYSGKNKVIICGSGATEEALERIIDGTQTMTVFTPVCSEATAAVDIGISLMTEEVTDSYVIEHSSWRFKCRYNTSDYDNGKKIVPSFLIEPVAVTKDNYKSVLVDEGYYRMDGKYPKLIA